MSVLLVHLKLQSMPCSAHPQHHICAITGDAVPLHVQHIQVGFPQGPVALLVQGELQSYVRCYILMQRYLQNAKNESAAFRIILSIFAASEAGSFPPQNADVKQLGRPCSWSAAEP